MAAKKKPDPKPVLGHVVGGNGDPAMVERFRAMAEADAARAARIRAEADQVAASVTVQEPTSG